MKWQTDEKNLYWQGSDVSIEERSSITNSQGVVLWLTGLSGSGKSTIAACLEKRLNEKGVLSACLDGDYLRKTVSSDLGFSAEDRLEHLRRVSHIAKLFYNMSIITMVSVISPQKVMRDCARQIIGNNFFYEIYVQASIDTCKQRDPKGLYQKAEQNKINSFTGVSSPYEEPLTPDILLNTEIETVESCTNILMDFLANNNYINIGVKGAN